MNCHRKGTMKRIADRLHKHAERTAELMANGTPRAEASRIAYQEILDRADTPVAACPARAATR